MSLVDSVDKIVKGYFSVVADEDFEYKGVLYPRKELIVSPLLFRGFTCPDKCGGCCPRFSLDYLPNEPLPHTRLALIKARTVKFNGHLIMVMSDMQTDHNNHHCRNLIRATGRCGIHGRHPFSCDFELIRTLTFQNAPNRLTQKLYGRGWAMLRVDDKRGARCEMLPPDENSVKEVIRKLVRLEQWAIHFRIRTRVTKIIKWAQGESSSRCLPLTLK